MVHWYVTIIPACNAAYVIAPSKMADSKSQSLQVSFLVSFRWFLLKTSLLWYALSFFIQFSTSAHAMIGKLRCTAPIWLVSKSRSLGVLSQVGKCPTCLRLRGRLSAQRTLVLQMIITQFMKRTASSILIKSGSLPHLNSFPASDSELRS